MGGFNFNIPGLNFNLTPEAIAAAKRVTQEINERVRSPAADAAAAQRAAEAQRQAAARQAEQIRLAREKAERDRLAALEAERQRREAQAARDRAEANRQAAAKAAREKAERERQAAEAARRAEEARRAEAARQAEAERRAEEAARQREEARRAEAARQAEAARKAEEARQAEAARRRREELEAQAEAAAAAERSRLQAQIRREEEAERQRLAAEEAARRRREEEAAARAEAAAAARRKAEQDRQREEARKAREAEAARQAELDRIAEQERIAEEAARRREEQRRAAVTEAGPPPGAQSANEFAPNVPGAGTSFDPTRGAAAATSATQEFAPFEPVFTGTAAMELTGERDFDDIIKNARDQQSSAQFQQYVKEQKAAGNPQYQDYIYGLPGGKPGVLEIGINNEGVKNEFYRAIPYSTPEEYREAYNLKLSTPTPRESWTYNKKFDLDLKDIASLALAAAIPFAAPAVAGGLAGATGIGALGGAAGTALTGAALGAGKAALFDEDIGKGALTGGIGTLGAGLDLQSAAPGLMSGLNTPQQLALQTALTGSSTIGSAAPVIGDIIGGDGGGISTLGPVIDTIIAGQRPGGALGVSGTADQTPTDTATATPPGEPSVAEGGGAPVIGPEAGRPAAPSGPGGSQTMDPVAGIPPEILDLIRAGIEIPVPGPGNMPLPIIFGSVQDFIDWVQSVGVDPSTGQPDSFMRNVGQKVQDIFRTAGGAFESAVRGATVGERQRFEDFVRDMILAGTTDAGTIVNAARDAGIFTGGGQPSPGAPPSAAQTGETIETGADVGLPGGKEDDDEEIIVVDDTQEPVSPIETGTGAPLEAPGGVGTDTVTEPPPGPAGPITSGGVGEGGVSDGGYQGPGFLGGGDMGDGIGEGAPSDLGPDDVGAGTGTDLGLGQQAPSQNQLGISGLLPVFGIGLLGKYLLDQNSSPRGRIPLEQESATGYYNIDREIRRRMGLGG